MYHRYIIILSYLSPLHHYTTRDSEIYTRLSHHPIVLSKCFKNGNNFPFHFILTNTFCKVELRKNILNSLLFGLLNPLLAGRGYPMAPLTLSLVKWVPSTSKTKKLSKYSLWLSHILYQSQICSFRRCLVSLFWLS